MFYVCTDCAVPLYADSGSRPDDKRRPTGVTGADIESAPPPPVGLIPDHQNRAYVDITGASRADGAGTAGTPLALEGKPHTEAGPARHTRVVTELH